MGLPSPVCTVGNGSVFKLEMLKYTISIEEPVASSVGGINAK